MSKPVPPPADIADYRDQVMRRDLRVCGWLGLEPGMVLEVEDTDPDEYGQVKVSWRATAMLPTSHGQLIRCGVEGSTGFGDPVIHTGTVLLHPIDAEALAEVAGPKPEMFTPEQRAQLEQLRP